MNTLRVLLLGSGSTLFLAGMVLLTIGFALLFPLLILLPYHWRYSVLIRWSAINLWWLRVTCGVSYRVEGKENLPADRAAIVMSNHQSTFETFAFSQIFPPITWVLKRELMRVPLFGWGLRMIKPVAIDRLAGRSAVEQVKEQGKERLDEGIWIAVFPEGTRVRPGHKKPYKLGGAILGAHTGYPVVPVAHNAGDSWPRHSYIKKPGVITFSIGEPILTEGKAAEKILREVEEWIEAEKTRLVFEEPSSKG